MTFWTDSAFEPLRKHIFLVSIGGASDIKFNLKTCTLPNWETDLVEYKLINHMIKYPGIGKWGDCQMSFVATTTEDHKKFLSYTGYRSMASTTSSTLTKGSFLGNPRIRIYNNNGGVITTWMLNRAWVQSIEFGELSYEDDGFVEVNLTISFDWASIS